MKDSILCASTAMLILLITKHGLMSKRFLGGIIRMVTFLSIADISCVFHTMTLKTIFTVLVSTLSLSISKTHIAECATKQGICLVVVHLLALRFVTQERTEKFFMKLIVLRLCTQEQIGKRFMQTSKSLLPAPVLPLSNYSKLSV